MQISDVWIGFCTVRYCSCSRGRRSRSRQCVLGLFQAEPMHFRSV